MTHSEMLNAWQDDRTLAEDMGVAYHRARDWRRRNSIPPQYWPKFVCLCESRGIEGVSLETLVAATQSETAA